MNIPEGDWHPEVEDAESEGKVWKPLLTCRLESDISLVDMILSSEGIDYVVEDRYARRNNPFLPLSGGAETPLIRVPAEELERATQALRDAMQEELSDTEPDPELKTDAPTVEGPSGFWRRFFRILFPFGS